MSLYVSLVSVEFLTEVTAPELGSCAVDLAGGLLLYVCHHIRLLHKN